MPDVERARQRRRGNSWTPLALCEIVNLGVELLGPRFGVLQLLGEVF
jgi:hypothetical protein